MRFESTEEKNNQTARQDGETEILKETGMPEEPEKAEMPGKEELRKKSTVRDMTEGSIAGHLTAFALPLLFGCDQLDDHDRQHHDLFL